VNPFPAASVSVQIVATGVLSDSSLLLVTVWDLQSRNCFAKDLQIVSGFQNLAGALFKLLCVSSKLWTVDERETAAGASSSSSLFPKQI
jgi:hypothetical protein